MTNDFTRRFQMEQALELVLGDPQPMEIELPMTTGLRARAIVDTTENWLRRTSYIPIRGEIIVYSDRNVIDGIPYPAIKIGDGLAYAVDLPFVGDEITSRIMAVLEAHVSNTEMHTTLAEKEYWNNKLDGQLTGENLILAPAILDNNLIDQ